MPEESFDSWFKGIGTILEIGSDSALQMIIEYCSNIHLWKKNTQNKYGLRYNLINRRRKYISDDSDEEIDYICYASNTMTKEEWIDCYYFTKGIVIPRYLSGLMLLQHILIKFVMCQLIEYYKFLFDWSKLAVVF